MMDTIRYPPVSPESRTVAQRECERLRWLLVRLYREHVSQPGRPLACKCLALSDADRPCVACEVGCEVARFGGSPKTFDAPLRPCDSVPKQTDDCAICGCCLDQHDVSGWWGRWAHTSCVEAHTGADRDVK